MCADQACASAGASRDPAAAAVNELPDAATLNAALSNTIFEREKAHPGTQHSNLGGWQSDWEMDRWGGAAAIKLLAIGRNTANRITTDRQGKPVSIAWKANMWANINRSGHGNEFHSHPGSFWSAVYYVDDGGIGADPSLGGELEFMDPRGPGPAMYAPHLAYGKLGLSVGANETVRPSSRVFIAVFAPGIQRVIDNHAVAQLLMIVFEALRESD